MTSISNLAVLLDEDLDKVDEAEPLYEEVLTARRDKLGSKHQATLDSIYNMGSFMQKRGELSRAQELFDEALSGYTEVLGEGSKKSQMARDALNSL